MGAITRKRLGRVSGRPDPTPLEPPTGEEAQKIATDAAQRYLKRLRGAAKVAPQGLLDKRPPCPPPNAGPRPRGVWPWPNHRASAAPSARSAAQIGVENMGASPAPPGLSPPPKRACGASLCLGMSTAPSRRPPGCSIIALRPGARCASGPTRSSLCEKPMGQRRYQQFGWRTARRFWSGCWPRLGCWTRETASRAVRYRSRRPDCHAKTKKQWR